MQFFNHYFFGILGHKLLICNRGIEIFVNMDQITQIRIAQVRNLTTNFFLLVLSIYGYYYSALYLHFNLNNQLLLELLLACLFSLSISLKFYTNTLFIITKGIYLHKINIPNYALSSVIDFRNNFSTKTIVINNLEF